MVEMPNNVRLRQLKRQKYIQRKQQAQHQIQKQGERATDDLLMDHFKKNSTDPMQAQVQLLGDTRLSNIQRQHIAKQIGQQYGNHHLQRVVDQIQRTPDANLIQREGEGGAGNVENSEFGGTTYTVVAGDSLWKIAKNTYGSGTYWREIYKANPDKCQDGGDLILIGTVLDLPKLSVPVASTTEPAEADGGEVEAVGPIGISNEFGSFDVYPDEFVGPLPLSVRDAATWPIRQSNFDALVENLEGVRDGTANMEIEGTDDFKTHVYLDLAWLMTVDVGVELIDKIQAADHNLKFKITSSGNEAVPDSFDDSFEKETTPPTANKGSNVTVLFNPHRMHIKDGTLDWHKRPPAIGLAHEMIHAWTCMEGILLRGTNAEGTMNAELQTVGLGKYKNDVITENRFRAAFGLPERPEY